MTNKALKSSSNLEETIDKLRNSPAFAMSRGGRELYHTNFLAFVIEQETTDENQDTYPHQVKKSLLKKLFSENNLPRNVLVLREKLNLDLLIIPKYEGILDVEDLLSNESETKKIEKSLEIIVIEAKLKSIPTLDQLERYSERLNQLINIDLFDGVNSSKIIINADKKIVELNNGLSRNEKRKIEYSFNNIHINGVLLAPKIFELPLPKGIWKNIAWSDFLENVPELNTGSDTTSIYINDYLNSTNLTIQMIAYVSEIVEGFINDNVEFKVIHDFVSDNRFKKMRIHDLIGKVVYQQLANHFYQNLTEKGNLICNVFLSNATPGFEIKLIKPLDRYRQFSVGIQLQGNDYRHFVCRNYTDDSSKLEIIAEDNRKWMKSDGNTGVRGGDDFKKFDANRFLYLSRNISSYKLDELCEIFKNSLSGAQNMLGYKVNTSCEH